MEGPKVYAFAKRVMVESCLRVLDPSGKAGKERIAQLSLIRSAKSFPTRPMPESSLRCGRRSGIPARTSPGEVQNKMIMTIEKYGNNSTASIPLALDESLSNGKIKKGDLVILVGFGAGLTYAANLVRL